MNLPSDLLQAVSSPSGGKIALVVGAGCSVEFPTSLPTSREWAIEVHRRLLRDRVLEEGDCSDPTDLSVVADAVFAKRNSQRDMVERLCEFNLKLATPNDGYRIAAAMLCEGVISSIITLNYDLALSNALSHLGAGIKVGVIERPEDLHRQESINVYYLHRNVNEADPELWVLRTAALEQEWKDHWESVIATNVLTAPVVVFVGLGTPIAVLVASAKLLRNALPAVTKFYQVDPVNMGESEFFRELHIDSSAYIQCGWCQFMDQLSQRLLEEYIHQLKQAVSQKVRDDGLPMENITDLLNCLKNLGLVNLGALRANWLLYDRLYRSIVPDDFGLMAFLLLTLAMMSRISGAAVIIVEDGLVEFIRENQTVTVLFIASGRGDRGMVAVEAEIQQRLKKYRSRRTPPQGVIVGGTWDTSISEKAAPADIIHEVGFENIVTGPSAFPMYHINELRASPERIHEIVP